MPGPGTVGQEAFLRVTLSFERPRGRPTSDQRGRGSGQLCPHSLRAGLQGVTCKDPYVSHTRSPSE